MNYEDQLVYEPHEEEEENARELWPEFDDDDDDYDEFDEALDNCGQDRNGYCSLAGTEECEFDCPFNR